MSEAGVEILTGGSEWPSVDDAKPAEEGGPLARTGFNYQDEVAVSFLVQMLGAPSLLKIHCETHDDIVLVWLSTDQTDRTAEYVQVKARPTSTRQRAFSRTA